MDSLSKKTLQTSRHLTYTYYVSRAKGDLPTLLLIHGWPDNHELWSDLITNHLLPAGYGVVAIDCLGYGGTSKPVDAKMYSWEGMTADLCDILDAEGLQKIVSLGHDWGSGLAQRLWLFHPERMNGLVLLNVPYIGPSSEPFDLDKWQAMLTPMLGYFTSWYWYLFASPEGPEILSAHLDSLFDVLHGNGDSWMETLCKKDGIKDFLLQDKKQDVQPYATEDRRKAFVERFKKDGFEAPLAWYRAMVSNVHYEEEKAFSAESYIVTVPTLYVGSSEDKVCLTAGIYPPKEQGLLPQLTIEELQATHWSILSKPKEMGEVITKWLKKTF
jgi:soluble epoxide hydrolase / lipid-phosphate phosphatase